MTGDGGPCLGFPIYPPDGCNSGYELVSIWLLSDGLPNNQSVLLTITRIGNNASASETITFCTMSA